MPKFVLIDSSLQGVGGHHFEYARHLLRAAEQVGFEPWLATHRKFRDSAELPEHWRVLPTYQRGIYSRRRILARAAAAIGSVSAEPRLPESRSSAAEPAQSEAAEASNRGWPMRWLTTWWNERRRAKRSTAFERDTVSLFRQLILQPGDQVFLAAISELELLGLAQFLSRDDRSGGVDWHLQFHFPIFAGYEPDYHAQASNLEGLQRAFRKATTLAADHRLHFYATTEGLAVQYNRLGVAQFQSLPYPANPALQSSRDRSATHSGPLRITYLGDARHEKGYQFLPQIIGGISNDAAAGNRIRFIIQSDCNFSLPAQGANVAVVESKAMLERLDPKHIKLLDAPLDSEEFARQTLQTDIGLLPYDRAAYNVRCSGILVDLLAIGAPVVVPAGTWLADQLAEPNREYHVSLRHGQRVCARAITKAGVRLAVPSGAGNLVLFCRWPVDLKLCSGAYAAVEATCWGSNGTRLASWPTVVGPGRPDRLSTAFVRLPEGTEAVSLEWRNAYGSQPLDFREVEACFLAAEADRQTPRGAVGLVATDAAQFSILLVEIIEQYAHYRQTALGLARRWIDWHSPARVVAELLSQRPSIPLPGSSPSTHPGPKPIGRVLRR
ncbi:MAG TPA: hypothetical protein VHX65_16770 [Pirellulales bacterium]|nr:hypothetical protein [Pirellulales bacterium]